MGRFSLEEQQSDHHSRNSRWLDDGKYGAFTEVSIPVKVHYISKYAGVAVLSSFFVISGFIRFSCTLYA